MRESQPIPMLLWCPCCGERHVDKGLFATRVHHTHACQACGMVWRQAVVPTVGVAFLPGFKDEVPESTERGVLTVPPGDSTAEAAAWAAVHDVLDDPPVRCAWCYRVRPARSLDPKTRHCADDPKTCMHLHSVVVETVKRCASFVASEIDHSVDDRGAGPADRWWIKGSVIAEALLREWNIT